MVSNITTSVKVDEHNQFPGDTEYQISNPISGRYAKIDGASDWGTDKTSFVFYYVKFFGSFRVRPSENVNACTCRRNLGMRKSILQMILLCVE